MWVGVCSYASEKMSNLMLVVFTEPRLLDRVLGESAIPSITIDIEVSLLPVCSLSLFAVLGQMAVYIDYRLHAKHCLAILLVLMMQ